MATLRCPSTHTAAPSISLLPTLLSVLLLPPTSRMSSLWCFPGNYLTSCLRDVPSFFSPSPSPSPSQASSASDHQETPREPSPIPGSGCGNATPMFNHIRGKWCCSACDKPFRGKWECRRHIGITGKRAKCVACGGKLSGREDSLRRHFTKYCKGDVANLRFENAFTEV